MHQRVLGAICTAMGLAVILSGSPGKVSPQQLQKVPKPAPLAGTRWLLAESAGQRIALDGREPYFELRMLQRFESGSAGELSAAADSCGNRLTGAYREAGDRLEVRIVSSTLLACKVSANMPRESLRTILAGSPRLQIRGLELDLFESNGAVRARFIAANGE